MSSKRLEDMPWRRIEDLCLEDVFKTYWRQTKYLLAISVFKRRPTRGGKKEGLPCPVLKWNKKCPNFGKKGTDFGRKCPICVHLWVNSHLKKAVLRVSWRRNTKHFPCGALVLYVVHETFTEVSLFQETSFAPKNSWLRAWTWFIVPLKNWKSWTFR